MCLSFIILLFTIGSFQTGRGQSINLNGQIFEYATYYVSSFDLSTGATNVPIFRYTLESNEGYPVSLRIRFTAEIKSPVLGKVIALARVDVTHSELGTEVEIGQLDGLQKRLKASIVKFPHFDPTKERVKGNYS